MSDAELIDAFHKKWYDSEGTWRTLTYKGIPILQNPFDVWMIEEVIWERKPDVILEVGTYKGGLLNRIADSCDFRRMIVIDPVDQIEKIPSSPVHFIQGRSVDEKVVASVKKLVWPNLSCMAILDGDHRPDNVAEELRIYSQIVTPGQYLIVCDGNLGGNPVSTADDPGPAEPIRKFLAANSNYRADKSRERLMMTFFPNGWLERLS